MKPTSFIHITHISYHFLCNTSTKKSKNNASCLLFLPTGCAFAFVLFVFVFVVQQTLCTPSRPIDHPCFLFYKSRAPYSWDPSMKSSCMPMGVFSHTRIPLTLFHLYATIKQADTPLPHLVQESTGTGTFFYLLIHQMDINWSIGLYFP